eukprot:gene11238-biopygen1712
MQAAQLGNRVRRALTTQAYTT